jgi:hypothetical protein
MPSILDNFKKIASTSDEDSLDFVVEDSLDFVVEDSNQKPSKKKKISLVFEDSSEESEPKPSKKNKEAGCSGPNERSPRFR